MRYPAAASALPAWSCPRTTARAKPSHTVRQRPGAPGSPPCLGAADHPSKTSMSHPSRRPRPWTHPAPKRLPAAREPQPARRPALLARPALCLLKWGRGLGCWARCWTRPSPARQPGRARCRTAPVLAHLRVACRCVNGCPGVCGCMAAPVVLHRDTDCNGPWGEGGRSPRDEMLQGSK